MEAPVINAVNSMETEATTLEKLDDYEPVRSFSQAKSVIWIETVKIMKIAGPIIFNIICVYGIESVTLVFVGHLGKLQLSAVAVAVYVIIAFSYGLQMGMGSALETLCGQAFGAGQVFMLGIYMQRSVIIVTATCIILCPIYIFATPLLKLIGQEESISELAGKFAILSLPHMFSYAISIPTQKFLQSQRKVGVLALIGFVSIIIHVGLLWIFINVLGWGIVGAAIAYDISYWIVALAQAAYIVRYCKDGWKGLSWLAFKDIWGFVRLSVASAVMQCLEIWYFMILIILTGHLKNAVIAVGAISICLSVYTWNAMLFVGVNAAISVRVSNELGSGRPRAAKYCVIIVVLESLLIGLFFMALIIIFKDSFSFILTNSIDLQRAASKLAYLLSVAMILNVVQAVISGVAVGSGWQELVAYINLTCYYALGLPLGIILGYKFNLGVKGIWVGMLCGTALQTLVLLIITWKTNWNKEATQATERVEKWGGGVSAEGLDKTRGVNGSVSTRFLLNPDP